MAERNCFRVVPIRTKNTIIKTMKHNERKEGDQTGKHIDQNLSQYNKTLYGTETCDLWREVVEAIQDKRVDEEEWQDVKDTIYKNDLRFKDGDKIRKDAVLAAEIEVHYPGETKKDENGVSRPVDEKRFAEWEKETIKFINDRFGGPQKTNVKQIVEHMDETGKPHLHAVFIPMYTDKKGQQRLSYHQYINGPRDLANVQTDYAKYVEHLGFERGLEGSKVVHYDSLKKARSIMTQNVNATLPAPEKGESARDYWTRVNPEYEKVLVQRDISEMNNKRLYGEHEKSAQKDKKIHELEDQLQETMKSNVDMQQQIRDLQLELLESKREKEMERIGMELYDDKQILTEVYQPLKERFIREGEAYAIAHGLILDKDREEEKEISLQK